MNPMVIDSIVFGIEFLCFVKFLFIAKLLFKLRSKCFKKEKQKKKTQKVLFTSNVDLCESYLMREKIGCCHLIRINRTP